MKRGQHACESGKCEAPGRMKGWSHRVIFTEDKKQRTRKEYHWWCDLHYQLYMFGLVPYKCTETCLKAHGKRLGAILNLRDGLVWMDLTVSMIPEFEPGPNESAPLKFLEPHCPWCGDKMKPAEAKDLVYPGE